MLAWILLGSKLSHMATASVDFCTVSLVTNACLWSDVATSSTSMVNSCGLVSPKPVRRNDEAT
jgi:hypothetical protein